MRIFLALLLALLLADTITGSPTRSGRKTKGRRKRPSSSKRPSSTKKLYERLSGKLEELAESENARDDRIEKKMDDAIEQLKNSVSEMHNELQAFIAEDAGISDNMEAQIQAMSDKVEGLSVSVMDVIKSINDAMPNQHDDMTTHQLDHQDIHHDEREDSEHIDPMDAAEGSVPVSEGRQTRSAIQEEITEMSSGSGNGVGDQGAAAEDAVEAEYQDQGSSGSGEDPGYGYDGDDYSYGDYKA